MSTKTRFATVGWVALMLGISAAADDSTQTIHAGPLSFQTPKTWKQERPSSAMRKAQIKVDPVAGDAEPAEMSVISLAGGGGSVEQNVTRWEGQFSDNGKTAKAKVDKKKGKNVEVTRVEIAGKYSGGMSMSGQGKQEAKANYRLLGAIVMTPDTGYFLKLTGPDKTVASTTKDFDAMIESMTVDQ